MTAKTNPAGANPYYFWVHNASTAVAVDGDEMGNEWRVAINPGAEGRVSEIIRYGLITASGWQEWDIYDPDTGSWAWLYEDADDLVWFQLMDHYNFYAYEPYDWSSGKGYNLDYDDFQDGPDGPELVIEYATPPAERNVTIIVNAAKYTEELTGSENVTRVAWWSPRAAFADEALTFAIEGDPGAEFTAGLYRSDGTLVETVTDAIRVDGDYNFNIDLLDPFEDWVQLRVTDWSIASTWGRVEPVPAASMRNLDIYSYDTMFPQYDNPLGPYIIYKDQLMYLYWKTNMTDPEYIDYTLEIRPGGNRDLTVWSENMTWFKDSYFQIENDSNDFLVHWRYAIFTPMIQESGFDTKDGLIVDVSKDYVVATTGFWQPVIMDHTDNSSLTWTHTSYFYLNAPDQGVYCSLDQGTYKAGSDMTMTVQVGNHAKVDDYLSNVRVLLVADTGAVVGSGDGLLNLGENILTVYAPDDTGSYQARFVLYDDELVPDYQYIKDVPFVVTETGTGGNGAVPGVDDWIEVVNDFMADRGLDNEAGHWLVIAVLCVIIAVGFRKMPLVATALVLLVFAGALLAKWINPWFIVLCAGAFGFWLYGIIRGSGKMPWSRRDDVSSGGGEDE